jgi:hypothetical protein
VLVRDLALVVEIEKVLTIYPRFLWLHLCKVVLKGREHWLVVLVFVVGLLNIILGKELEFPQAI